LLLKQEMPVWIMDRPVWGHQGAIHCSCGTASGEADQSPAIALLPVRARAAYLDRVWASIFRHRSHAVSFNFAGPRRIRPTERASAY